MTFCGGAWRARERNARGTRGRENAETAGKRLAETVFNMAASCDFHEADVPHANNEYANVDIDEEVRSLHATLERPFHEAFRNGKKLCPKDSCVEKMEFFEHNGIDHHFRTKHNAPFTNSDNDDSLRKFRTLYEKETKDFLEMIFKCREKKVRTV